MGQKGHGFDETDTVPMVVIDEKKKKCSKPGTRHVIPKFFTVTGLVILSTGVCDFWEELFKYRRYIFMVIKMEKEFTIVIEQDEDGIYVASVPELKGCHTQAKTLDELRERIKEAIKLYLEVESSIVEEVPLKLVGIHKVQVTV